ncbi:hypothetical protein HG530_014666 [Fusarium avenaceum]|nr:hypothetical protein HG530_014666 [Fusarium avenaceum]
MRTASHREGRVVEGGADLNNVVGGSDLLTELLPCLGMTGQVPQAVANEDGSGIIVRNKHKAKLRSKFLFLGHVRCHKPKQISALRTNLLTLGDECFTLLNLGVGAADVHIYKVVYLVHGFKPPVPVEGPEEAIKLDAETAAAEDCEHRPGDVCAIGVVHGVHGFTEYEFTEKGLDEEARELPVLAISRANAFIREGHSTLCLTPHRLQAEILEIGCLDGLQVLTFNGADLTNTKEVDREGLWPVAVEATQPVEVVVILEGFDLTVDHVKTIEGVPLKDTGRRYALLCSLFRAKVIVKKEAIDEGNEDDAGGGCNGHLVRRGELDEVVERYHD